MTFTIEYDCRRICALEIMEERSKDVKGYAKRIRQCRMFTIFIEAGAREQCTY